MKPESVRPVAYADLGREDYPFTIEFYRIDTGAVVHTARIDGPGVLHVPPLAQQYGVPIGVRFIAETGETATFEP